MLHVVWYGIIMRSIYFIVPIIINELLTYYIHYIQYFE